MKAQYALNPVQYFDTMQEMLICAAKKYGSRIAATCYDRQGNKSEYSFVQVKEDIFSFAKSLALHDLAGKHVAVIGENSYEWVVAYLGCAITGGVAVCIDIEQSQEAIAELIDQSDTAAMVTSASMLVICEEVAKANPNVQRIIAIGEQGERGFDSFLSQGKPADDGIIRMDCFDKNNPAAIVFTSGTTGRAKAVLLSHYALLTNAGDALAMISVDKPFMFAMLPFYHAYGFTCTVLTSLMAGFNFCISGDLKTMIRDMTLFQPEIIIAVPLVVEALHKFVWNAIEKAGQKKKVRLFMKLGMSLGKPSLFLKKAMQEKFRGTCLERLKTIVSGGAYLSQSVAEDLTAFGITVLQGYGITECSPLVSVNRNKSFTSTSVGFVVPHFAVKIKDEEILVKGDSLMNGYYDDEEQTLLAFDDGWFKTGDIGYIDRSGHLFIQGRKKNLIVMKNGKKISPEEIEAAVRADAMVKDVLAYGLSSGESADDVKLAIMVYPDPDATKRMESYEILEHLQRFVDAVNANLPAYKQIQMINIREQDFSRTATKKIRRDAI